MTVEPSSTQTFRVLAETAYPVSTPAARVRAAAFTPFLREHGVQLELLPTLSDSGYGIVASDAPAPEKIRVIAAAAVRAMTQTRPAHDLFLVQRLRFLSPLPLVDPPRRLDVYDFDDALFLPAEGALNSRFQWVKQESRRCLTYMRRARLTIAGNSFLADHARRYAPRVEVIPSCVDPARQGLHEHKPNGPLTVGWIGSRTTSAYLRAVLPAFARLNAAAIRIKLVLVGADPALEAPWIEHRPWSLATQERDLASFDVGIMPLPDNQWARGKCGYKLLQYFAAGVPAIASPVGVAAEMVGTDRGVLAASIGDWERALESLLDAGERRERGMAARTFVERHYSYQHWAPRLAELLRSLG